MVSPSGLSSSKLKSIMATLKAPEDDMAQLETLGRLCEMLSISSEEQLSVLPVDQLVPVLVSLLNAEHSPDLMLLAARAITFLADVMPSACSAIVRHGAVPAFCARLMTIEYIDLAEQSLQALEKLSHEHPAACLRHGGLLATLSYLDFFQTGVQRVAVATAANMCRFLTSENTEAVSSAVPMLTSLLQYSDAKVVDNACLALSRIAQAFSSSPKSLEMLCEYGLITNAVQLISVSETGSMTSQLSVSTYYGLIKLLSTCVKGSHTVAENLLQAGMSGTLRNLLQSSTLFSTSRTSPASVLRSSDQLLEVVSLAHELLPPVPDAAQLLLADANPATEAEGKALSDCHRQNRHQQSAAPSSRELFLHQNPELLQKFGSDLLPLLLQVYNNTALPQVRKQCLAAIAKILHYTPAAVLDNLLKDIAISSCIAGLLASKDAQVVARALQLAEVLMQKLPSVFLRYFAKEGVVHAIDQLAAAASPPLPVPKEPKRKGRRQSPRAKKFRACYLPSQGSGAELETEGVQRLREVCRDLAGEGKVQELAGPGGSIALVLANAVLQDKGASNISTFELLSSGAVRQLRAHLLGADLQRGQAAMRGKGKRDAQPSSAASMSRHQVALLERLRSFAQAGLTPGVGGTAPMQPLVRKLQQALAATEAFPVADSHEVPVGRTGGLRYGGSPFFGHSRSIGDGSSLGNGLAALSQPFKLRLAAASHEKQLVDYSVNVVLIDTMASLSAVEDFLYGKVYRSAAAAEQALVADRSPQAAASDAHIGAALARDAEPSGRSSGEEAQQSTEAPGAGAAGAGARRPRSAKQDIPHGKTTASQRMTRASARRAAAELDHHQAPAEEEAVQAQPSEAVLAEGPSSTSEEDEGMMMMEEDDHYDDDELDDEIGHEEDEPPTFGSAPVHDVHVGPSDGSAAAAATAAHAEQVIAAASAAAASAAVAAQDARTDSDQAAAGGSGSLPQTGRSAGQAAPSRLASAQATRTQPMVLVRYLACIATREEFISSKLAPKLAQQLKDVLAICGDSLPPWCQQLVFSCKFLFPFDMRRRFFYCTAFGPDRALQHLRQLQIAEGGSATHTDREIRDSRSTRISRQKVRVSRMRILESAEKVMSLYASSKAILELEYFNEVGTGLGPTLEFYTLLSHELQRKGLGMWHSDDGVSTPGLFAAPQHPTKRKASGRVLELFKLLGRAMAKALQDGRLLDLPLSYVFYRATLGQPLDLYDIRRFDAGIGATLEKLHAAHQAHLQAGRQGPLMVDGVPIGELCLTFVLPGYPEYPLRPDGADVMVDASNVSSYIKAVVDALLETGIKAQLDAFRDGFNEVFSLSVLACFFEDEIEAMLCGAGESWTVEALAETIKFDHGYTAQSTAISHFLQARDHQKFDAADQRRFLRFVTGTPRLPPGGIAALHPRLTVVRKHTSQSSDPALGASASPAGSSLGHQGSGSLADGDLPSVMTCANYIKLPPYSSKAVMKERVLYAIREGQGSFDLS
eukprot:jgi/Astpho2/5589/e_gw1.00079.2.1_t